MPSLPECWMRRLLCAQLVIYPILATILVFLLPPFQAPDEVTHFGFFSRHFGTVVDGVGDEGCDQIRQFPLFLMAPNVALHPQVRVPPGLLAPSRIRERPPQCGWSTIYAPNVDVLAYPGAFAARMVLRKETEKPYKAVTSYFLARFFQACIIVFAFSRWRKMASLPTGVFTAFCFLAAPLAVQQSVSFTYDAVGLAGLVLGISFYGREKHIPHWEKVIFLLLVWGACRSKPVLAPVFASTFGLLLWFSRDRSRAFAISCAVVAVGSALLTMTGGAMGSAINPISDPPAQWRYIFANPGATLEAFRKTFDSTFRFTQLVDRYGSLDTYTPRELQVWWFAAFQGAIAFDVILFVSALLRMPLVGARAAGRAVVAFLVKSALVWGAALTCMAGTYLSLYLTWNRPGAESVGGVQGRYYLVPLVSLLVSVGFFLAPAGRGMGKEAADASNLWSKVPRRMLGPLNTNAGAMVGRLVGVGMAGYTFLVWSLVAVTVALTLHGRYW